MAETQVVRVVHLPADPLSAATARRAVREVLSEAQGEHWRDAAELAVSELVTNAVLHAHSAVELTIACGGSELHVSVKDESSSLPSQRSYGESATTGRGLAMVAAVTDAFGVTVLGDGGKAVWFVLASGPGDSQDVAVDDWSSVIEELTPSAASDRIPVRLIELPTTLWLAAEQRQDALLRELALMRGTTREHFDQLRLADEARVKVTTAVMASLARAQAAGEVHDPLPANHPANLDLVPPSMTIDVPLTEADAHKFGVLQDVLDDAERRASRSEMLSRPGLPEVIALRDWVCEQIISQLNGHAGSAWPGTEAERFSALHNETDWSVDWDTRQISESSAGLVAADDSNRIIAVSPSLADVLGWTAQDLVGRRVVAIVPPRFREAHVAGFTRHLTTGQAHALDIDLELPVWRKDGTELVCSFFITAHRTPGGRTVYVSRISPLA